MEQVKIVVRFRDGHILKGFTQNFQPNKPNFHLRPNDSDSAGKLVEVWLEQLKAVFFVKDFLGNPAHEENKNLPSGKRTQGRAVGVLFEDGERLVGTTMGYDPNRQGFFLTPFDPEGNNLRVYIVSKAVKEVRFF